jgi:flagellar biosynthesis/type III secretory pathway chaperone
MFAKKGQIKKGVSDLNVKELSENLFKVMEEELKLHKYILEVSNLKTKVIVDGDIRKLEEIMKIEQAFVLKMGKLENLRERIAVGLARDIGISMDKLNIVELLQRVKQEDVAVKIKNCRDEMLKIVNELKNANEVNSKLIENSLEYIDFSINMLSSVDDGTNNYGNTGTVQDKTKRNYFDIKF